MIKRGLIFLFFVFCFFDLVSGLGLSPAIVEFDFAPGEVHEITFSVHSENPQQEVEVFLGGDFAKYASLSTEKLVGSGNFKILIKFPDSIELPGRHDLGVGVREIPGEQEFIGTRVEVIGAIRINVPYPGRYAEVDLSVKDGNVNEQIPIEVHVSNKGKEDLDINVNIEFFSDNGLTRGDMVYNIPFKSVFLKTNEDRYFRKFLDTTDFKPGNYIAEAVVNYGDEIKVNRKFRIGSLFVNITNFTQTLPKEGIQKFFVEIESKWNNHLDEVYADVNISNSTKNIEFRTPSADLNPWETKTLTGFLDTNELDGEYETKVTLYYAGEKSFASGELLILRKGLNFTFLIAGIIAILFILVVIFAIWKIKKRAFKLNVKVKR